MAPAGAEESGFALPAGSELLEYRLERVLGQGGFGITYLAQDTLLHERVAIKEYLPHDFATRDTSQTVRPRTTGDADTFRWGLDAFLNEARTIARFRHPSIMRVRRYFQAHGTGYIVMDFEDGASLEDWVKQGTPDEAALRAILVAVLEGLGPVHEAGVLHRDIKPSNIIIRPDGSPVLIDFGAARDFRTRASRALTVIFTAGYAPLEQYSASSRQGPWSDLYALGAVAYRVVTGKRPPEAVLRHRDDPMVPAAVAAKGRFSPPFLEAIDWALTPDERERPQTAAALRDVLLGAQPVPPRRPAPTPVNNDSTIAIGRSLARPVRRSRGQVFAGVGAVLILGAAAAFYRAYPPATPVRDAAPPATSAIQAPVALPAGPTAPPPAAAASFAMPPPALTPPVAPAPNLATASRPQAALGTVPASQPAPPPDLEADLREALSVVGEPERGSQVARYLAGKDSRAMAVMPRRGSSWYVQDYPDPAITTTRVLEGCQSFSNEPCILVALDGHVLPRNAAGTWTLAPQPRLAYRGPYDPNQVPVSPAVRASRTVLGYGSVAGPKALAYHPWGRVFLGTGADTIEAQASALKSCNDDPERNGANGPCFLYAIDNDVVLPDRRIDPVTAAQAELEAELRSALTMLKETDRNNQARRYAAEPDIRALAVAPVRGASWRVRDFRDPQSAATRALEGCQIYYDEPCMLVALGDRVLPPDRSGSWPLQPQRRVGFRGDYDPDQVPVSPGTRKSASVAGYRGLPEPKALAYHPWGRIFAGTGSDAVAAQTEALKACNEDPQRKGAEGPCFVYAVGNKVVLPDRRTAPVR